ncbi:hypothetical protein Tco_1529557, partial [Tanacetum coccineum]
MHGTHIMFKACDAFVKRQEGNISSHGTKCSSTTFLVSVKSFNIWRINLECKSAIKRQRQKECIINAIRSWGMPGGSLQLLRETLAESSPTLSDVNDEDIELGERNIKQCKRKISDGHYIEALRVLSSPGVAPYGDAT